MLRQPKPKQRLQVIVKFDISELEKVVHPDNLIDVMDSLLQEGKLLNYFWDWQNGVVEMEISKSAIIEELFKEKGVIQ